MVLLFFGFGVCLLAMYLMDTLQVLLRALAGLAGVAVLGAHLGSMVMLANRIATSVALLLLGYMVDTGVSALVMVGAFGCLSVLIAIGHVVFIRKRLVLRVLLSACAAFYGRAVALPRMTIAAKALRGRVAWVVSPSVAFVSALGLAGFLVPSLAAAKYPDFRATLMQTGFVLNSIATIVNVMVVEKRISLTIDGGSTGDISALYDSYVLSRAVGYVCGALIFVGTVPLFSEGPA